MPINKGIRRGTYRDVKMVTKYSDKNLARSNNCLRSNNYHGSLFAGESNIDNFCRKTDQNKLKVIENLCIFERYLKFSDILKGILFYIFFKGTIIYISEK